MDYKPNPLISIKGLHKYYQGNHILKGIDLDVHSGELISIIGRSGCGKTTLLRCLNCLEILDSGRLHVAGVTLSRKRRLKSNKQKAGTKIQDIRKRAGLSFKPSKKKNELDEDFQLKAHALRTRVGMLFQSLNLFPHLTVLENVKIAPIVVKKEQKNISIKKAEQLLDKVGLLEFKDRLPLELSGGQAQRVAIARALAMSPQVMLYDEPTSALDPELVAEVLNVMKNLHDEGMTQIIVTHAMSFAKNASDRVIYMEDGNIVEIGPPSELFSNPKDERTRHYLNILED